MTNGSGTVSDSFTYGAWGAVLNTPQSNLKPYQYVGQLGYYQHSSDRGTAMHDLLQLGVRFYDRDMGRFTQRDPERQSIVGWLYGGNQPLRYVDPSGTIAFLPPVIIPIIRGGRWEEYPYHRLCYNACVNTNKDPDPQWIDLLISLIPDTPKGCGKSAKCANELRKLLSCGELRDACKRFCQLRYEHMRGVPIGSDEFWRKRGGFYNDRDFWGFLTKMWCTMSDEERNTGHWVYPSAPIQL